MSQLYLRNLRSQLNLFLLQLSQLSRSSQQLPQQILCQRRLLANQFSQHNLPQHLQNLLLPHNLLSNQLNLYSQQRLPHSRRSHSLNRQLLQLSPLSQCSQDSSPLLNRSSQE